MITIDGSRQPETQKVRYLVVVDGEKVWLSAQNFRIMLFLAIGRRSLVNGWVPVIELAGAVYTAKYIYKLKKEIRNVVPPYWDGIEHDHGYYRLKCAPEHISIVTENCMTFPDEDVRLALAALGQKKEVGLG